MAQLFCTGPAHVHVGLPGGFGSSTATIIYLGTCEDSPRVTLRPMTAPVLNSITGGVPMDLSFQGEEGFIGLDLTRWNQPVLDGIRSRATASSRPGVLLPGTWVPGDIGTLMITENAEIAVFLTFPYAAKTAMLAGGMPLGYRFPFCAPIGPDDIGPLGTRARKEHVMFHAIPGYNPNGGGLTLYDQAVAGLPAIN
jgi:hypothetical protein